MTGRGLIVAAPRSGSGKTIVTLALLAALKRRGLEVRSAKAGPDYIDAAFHGAATGSSSVNLDSWAMPPPLIDALTAEVANSADIFLIEGVMGLFDGTAAPTRRSGSTADLAARFRLPVLLVLDVSGQSQSAAAIVRGFASHDPAVRILGVVLNRVGSERHRKLTADAIAALGVPLMGALPRDEALTLPQRHLGLVQAGEYADLTQRLSRLAAIAERHLDLDALIAGAVEPTVPVITSAPALLPPPGQRVALASDKAFAFMYPHVLSGWQRAGAEIVPFSPLADEAPPESCDSCWLPGGYPELHAGTLAAARRFQAGLKAFAETREVHGECGGYMILGQGLEDADGRRHAMTGLLGHSTSFAKHGLSLGYREARLCFDGPLGTAGTLLRGHEFHYATLADPGRDEPFADVVDGQGHPSGTSGGRRGRVSGTFFHAIATAQSTR